MLQKKKTIEEIIELSHIAEKDIPINIIEDDIFELNSCPIDYKPSYTTKDINSHIMIGGKKDNNDFF